MKRAVILHFHEINLKGNNRGWFENRLHQHVSNLLRGLDHTGIERFGARMCIRLGESSRVEEICSRLGAVFGIANYALAWELPADYEIIRESVAALVGDRTFRSFRIQARRGTKDFLLNSQQLNEQLGQMVKERTGAAVNLDDPELTVYVEVVGKRAFIYFDKRRGAGGLPSGTGGKVVCLISGGIDSPVAAYRMMRRGCHAIFVHFHSFPHTSAESQDKVRRLLGILGRYQLESRLLLVPFADIQREIVAFAPPALRVVLYRRFMMRIAEALAHKERAPALVTGDSLGQVASQTLENLRTISGAVRLPIFRPLVGDDKEDIMRTAREIGTYSISILPDQDCCSVFVPRHPETMSTLEAVEAAEAGLDGSRLIQQALEAASRELILPDYSFSAAGTGPGGGCDSDVAELDRSI